MARHYADDKPAFSGRLKAAVIAAVFRTAHEKGKAVGRSALTREGFFRPDALTLADMRDFRHQLPDLDMLQVFPTSIARVTPPSETRSAATEQDLDAPDSDADSPQSSTSSSQSSTCSEIDPSEDPLATAECFLQDKRVHFTSHWVDSRRVAWCKHRRGNPFKSEPSAVGI